MSVTYCYFYDICFEIHEHEPKGADISLVLEERVPVLYVAGSFNQDRQRYHNFMLKNLSSVYQYRQKVQTSARSYCYDTEHLCLFHRFYKLHVQEDAKLTKIYIENKDKIYILHVKSKNDVKKIQSYLSRFYDRVLLDCIKGYIQDLGVHFPKFCLKGLKLSNLTCKYGYYRPKDGSLVFSKHLIANSYESIYYVVAHELCHSLYEEHDYAFFSKLRSIISNFDAIESKLSVHYNTRELYQRLQVLQSEAIRLKDL